MVPVATIALASATIAWGAPAPSAVVLAGPELTTTVDAQTHRRECFLRYRFRARDTLDAIAEFYLREARDNGAVLLDDTATRIAGYRAITFTRHKFMFVTLSRQSGVVVGNVVFQPPGGCAAS